MNETMLTVRGNVVDTPKLRSTKNGHMVANFRVASTQRRFDRDQGAWVDGDTLFVTVTAWRGMGENAAKSLQKGHPVVVYGRYYQRDYTQEETVKIAYELDAIAIGHDLSRGITTFDRVVHSLAPQLETDGSGGPVDASGEFLDLVEDDDGIAAAVDPVTGEVREFAPA